MSAGWLGLTKKTIVSMCTLVRVLLIFAVTFLVNVSKGDGIEHSS